LPSEAAVVLRFGGILLVLVVVVVVKEREGIETSELLDVRKKLVFGHRAALTANTLCCVAREETAPPARADSVGV